MSLEGRKRWLALLVLCFGDLMIVLDATIVNVALPSIRADLGFSATSLAWVVNAYLITFGGFLLIGGRLGDLFGHRRLFLIGISLFTAASLACGLSTSQGMLVTARSIQGLGAAIVAAVVLSLRLIPGERAPAAEQRLDLAGAVTVTVSLMLAVYAIVNGNEVGWLTFRTIGLLGVAAAIFAWFFLSALYLQLVLGYSPLEVGLAFLPGNLIMGSLSIAVSARLVMRYGVRLPLSAGLGVAAIGLLLFARAPVDGNYVVDVLPSMILLGLGAGIAFNPVLFAAMSDVEPTEAGLASGVVNTAFMMGGALGLAVLASVAASRTESLEASGQGTLEALTGGYHAAFLLGALFAFAAAATGAAFLRTRAAPEHGAEEAIAVPA